MTDLDLDPIERRLNEYRGILAVDAAALIARVRELETMVRGRDEAQAWIDEAEALAEAYRLDASSMENRAKLAESKINLNLVAMNEALVARIAELEAVV